MDSAPAPSAPRATVHIPPNHPLPLEYFCSDFARQQVAKQQHSNYHSTSLRTMVSTSVNRTALHPTGV
ncbi:Protein kinase C-like 1, partial [Ophidiomyces ophidiicola]